MPNGGHIPNDGFGGGYGVGFGRIPSQELKLNEKEETPLLLKQFRDAILILFGFIWALYIAINVLFGKNDLHNIVLGIYATLSIGVFIWLRRFFERRYDNYYLFSEQDENGEWRLHLTVNTLRAFVLAAALFIGLSTQTLDYTVSVIHFPEESHNLSVILTSVGRFTALSLVSALVLPVIAVILRLVFREIPDQYHADTNTKQNWDKVQLEREKLHWEQEKYYLEHPNINNVLSLPSANPESAFVDAIPMAKANYTPTAPLNEAQERFKEAVFDFLDGIDEGLWGTNERSWRSTYGKPKILKTSRFRLLTIGGDIRDRLIEGRWAQWKNPENTQQGWELLYSTDEIRNGAFNYDGKFTARTTHAGSGETSAGVSEEDMEE